MQLYGEGHCFVRFQEVVDCFPHLEGLDLQFLLYLLKSKRDIGDKEDKLHTKPNKRSNQLPRIFLPTARKILLRKNLIQRQNKLQFGLLINLIILIPLQLKNLIDNSKRRLIERTFMRMDFSDPFFLLVYVVVHLHAG